MIDLLGLIKSAFVVVVATISVLNPFNHPPSNDPIPTPVIIEQLSPTPKEVPVQKNTYVDPDPIIDCNSSYPNCINQTLKAKQSQCKYVFCCVYPDKAVLLHDKSQCVSTPSQNNQSNQPNNTSLVTCPDGYGNNVVESKDACNKRWEKIKNDLKNVNDQFIQAIRERSDLNSQKLKLDQDQYNRELQQKLQQQADDTNRFISELEAKTRAENQRLFEEQQEYFKNFIKTPTPTPTPSFSCPGGGCENFSY